MASNDLADRLLDAHVRFAVAELTGPRQVELVDEVVDELLAIGAELTLSDVLDPSEVERVVLRVLATVPPSPAATQLSQGAADVLHTGPTTPFTPADVISRDDVARIVDEVVRAQPLIKKALDEVVESPLIASVVSRFASRMVGDVLGTNRSADRVPGVGGLFGAASKVVSAGANGVEQLLGDTAGKGARLAARRLNKVAIDTLKDPQLKAAILQLWDAEATHELRGLGGIREQDLQRAVALAHDVAVGALGSAPVADLARRLVAMLFQRYGSTPVVELLDQLGITRDDLVADARSATAHALAGAHAAGHLVPFVRARLEPFYRSPEFNTVFDTVFDTGSTAALDS